MCCGHSGDQQYLLEAPSGGVGDTPIKTRAFFLGRKEGENMRHYTTPGGDPSTGGEDTNLIER